MKVWRRDLARRERIDRRRYAHIVRASLANAAREFKPTYTWMDARGMRWRWVGARPVSELADQTMRDAGVKLHGE